MKKKLKKLVKKAEDANKAYRSGSPFIDDEEYDSLTEEIEKIDPKNKFINTIEKEEKGIREEFKHEQKMLSIKKVFSIKDVIKFINECRKVYDGRIQIIISHKLDGIAAKKVNKKFATRGDGEVGYVIPSQISKHINFNDHQSWETDGINGEIVVSLDNFKKYLSESYSHPRNFVAGLANTDTLTNIQKLALKEGIVEFVIHEHQIESYLLNATTDTDKELTSKIEDIVSSLKSSSRYPTDGLVFTVKNTKIREKLGATNHHYRWQVALKEKSKSGKTIVEDIVFQIGRQGYSTPVLKVNPVQLSGAKISSVTAHNVQMLIDEGIGIGSEIEIIRSGEVIPKISKVLKKKSPNIPKRCPSCAMELKMDGLFLKCNNKLCPERLAQSVFHWFKCLDNSDWFGIETIRKMSRCGNYFIDRIYDMTEDDFIDCGFGEKQSKNLFESLQLSKEKEINDWKLLSAFGIPGIERGLSKKILEKYKINELTSLQVEDIMSIDGLGKKISKNFIKWMDENNELFDNMTMWFNIFNTKDISKGESAYSGFNILFTGSIEGFTREGIKEFAQKNGINVASSVSKNTNLVVHGENPGKSKIEKAEKLGVKIITFEEFKEKM